MPGRHSSLIFCLGTGVRNYDDVIVNAENATRLPFKA
jgi:hypothetical protein